MKRVVASLALVLLFACSRASVGIDAPSGWLYVPTPVGETWLKLGTEEMIVMKLSGVPRPKRHPSEVWTPIRICGNHPANVITMLYGEEPGKTWEAVDTDWDGKRYMAVYVRPRHSTPDPAAERAIRSMCKRP